MTLDPDQAVTSEELNNATILHELPPSTPKFDALTAEEKHAVVQKLQTTLSVKNEAQGQLAAKYDSQAAFLGAQDVNYVEAGNNEVKFLGHVGDFLQEVNRDQENYAALTKGNKSLQDQLASANATLSEIETQTGWTRDDLKKYAEAEMATSDLSYDAMSKSAGVLADMTKSYVNKMDGTAASYIQAWDRTKHNEMKENIFNGINAMLDLFTGFGIGGNAVTQFAMKEFREVSKTFDRITNAYWLRGGQVTDMAQAAMNAGHTFSKFASSTTAGITKEIEGNTESTNTHLVTLSKRFNDWITKYNEPREDHSSWFIPGV